MRQVTRTAVFFEQSRVATSWMARLDGLAGALDLGSDVVSMVLVGCVALLENAGALVDGCDCGCGKSG